MSPQLLQHPRIQLANKVLSPIHRLPTGAKNLDEALQGGIPASGLVRVVSHSGIGELTLFAPFLQQYRQKKLLFFINAPGALQATYLHFNDINSSRVYQVYAQDEKEALWSAEQCLRSGACHVVLLWCPLLTQVQARRLQVAAHQNETLCLLYQSRQQAKATGPLPISLDMTMAAVTDGLSIDINKSVGGHTIHNIRVDFEYIPTNSPILEAMACFIDCHDERYAVG